MTQEEKQTAIPKLRFSEFKNENKWTTESLGSLATIVNERVGDRECVPMSITSGVGLVSQIEKFGRIIAGDSYKNYVLIRKNDFAYNKSATKEYPEGFIAHYSGDEPAAVPNSIFTCFRINGDSPDPRYLNYLFLGNLHGRWLRKFIEVGARAHGSLSVKDDDLLALPIPLPVGKSSLAEQQKIAECLSTLDELIEAERRKLDALKNHKKGLMQQLFPREGETRPRLRFPEFRDAPEWEQRRLGDLVEIATGQVDPKEPPYCDLPQIGSENIESNTGKIVNVKTAREKGVISGNYVFDKEDVLYSKIRPALNKVAAPSFKGVCSADIYPVRPNSGSLLRNYLVFLLLSEKFLGYAIRSSDRGKIPKINREALLSYEAHVPSVDEQRRIADCLSSLDDLIAAQSERLEALRAHKRGLMQQLFPNPSEFES